MNIKYKNVESIYNFHNVNGVVYLSFKNLDDKIPWLKNSFSTRLGGKSTGAYASMNLSVKDEGGDLMQENTQLYFNAIGEDYEGRVASFQTHSNIIKVVEDFPFTNKFQTPCDGLITGLVNRTLVISLADCVPVYIVDTKKKLIGLVHSGWIGTLNNIVGGALEIFFNRFKSKPEDIIVALGPSICETCFEVKDDCANLFKEKYTSIIDKFLISKDGRMSINLYEVIAYNIKQFGISNIIFGNLCTKCNPELFYSHRLTGKPRGGMIGTMTIKEKL